MTFVPIEKAPCKDGEHHTAYVLAPGPEDGQMQPFPVENWALTTEEHQDKIRELVRMKNLELVVPRD